MSVVWVWGSGGGTGIRVRGGGGRGLGCTNVVLPLDGVLSDCRVCGEFACCVCALSGEIGQCLCGGVGGE